jgi:hypothetical protein
VALVCAGLACSLLVAEIAARAAVPPPPKPRTTVPAGVSPFERTPRGLIVYRPGSSFAHVYDTAPGAGGYFGADGRVRYRINNLGFRGPDVAAEKPPEVRRVLCLGDSFTFGEGVHEEDAWPRQLERLLGPGVQVINAGVQGYDFDSEGLLLLVQGRPLRPDAVIVGFFMNDAMTLEETTSHHVRMTEKTADLSRLGRASALWGFFERRHLAARETDRYVAGLRESFVTPRWKEARARIPRLRQLAANDGFTIAAMIFPLLHDFADYPLEREHAEVREAFDEAGIEAVDLLDSYRAYHAEDLWAHPVDPHPNRLAHSIAAGHAARLLAIGR